MTPVEQAPDATANPTGVTSASDGMEAFLGLVRERDVRGICNHMFSAAPGKIPTLRSGYKRETEAWDFKEGLPGPRAENERAWAEVAGDVLALHNARGGVLIFGISDRSFEFVGTRDLLDGKRFNDKIRRYVGDKFWVDFSREFIQSDQRYLGLAVVPPRGLLPTHAVADAPLGSDQKRRFTAGDLIIRVGDETKVLRGIEAARFLAARRLPSTDSRYLVQDGTARILRPDWDHFIERQDCAQVAKALRDKRTYVTTLSGVGGVGKTALACWGVLEAHKEKLFEYVVSVSAKDRELTARGIRPVTPGLTSFEDLLDGVLEVFGFSEYREREIVEREKAVRGLLEATSALLFVDNLETVDDQRVVQFLETLPLPTKAITTSRVAGIRTAAFPIAVGPLTVKEAVSFLEQQAKRQGKEGVLAASRAEKERLVEACSRVPLAIEWLVGQALDAERALDIATALNASGKKDEELLEFCYRRVHAGLGDEAQRVMSALALEERPQGLEALAVAAGLGLDGVETAISALESCSLVERVWDPKTRDFALKTLHLTRRFAYRELQRHTGEEMEIRRRLSTWYEARDVDEGDRSMVAAIRKGDRDPDAMLVDAAISYRKQGRIDEAERYFQKAIDRSPTSWRAHREFAELLRDQAKLGVALEHYARAAEHAPSRGSDRALVFREWGMLLRRSGRPKAHEEAAEKFEIARKETPNDPLVLHGLANSLVTLGRYRPAEPILELLIKSHSAETRQRSYDLLEKCYTRTNESLKLAELRSRRQRDDAARKADVATKRSVDGSSRAGRAGQPLAGPQAGRGRHRRR